MSLKNYQFAEAAVTGGLTVRGLSFVDISSLVRDHYALLAKVFDGVKTDEDFDVKKIVGKFAPAMPPLVAAIIAHGCGEPKSIDVAARLPFGVQIEAVQKIGELTFAIEGGAKKVFQMVMAAMQNSGAVMADLNT